MIVFVLLYARVYVWASYVLLLLLIEVAKWFVCLFFCFVLYSTFWSRLFDVCLFPRCLHFGAKLFFSSSLLFGSSSSSFRCVFVLILFIFCYSCWRCLFVKALRALACRICECVVCMQIFGLLFVSFVNVLSHPYMRYRTSEAITNSLVFAFSYTHSENFTIFTFCPGKHT